MREYYVVRRLRVPEIPAILHTRQSAVSAALKAAGIPTHRARREYVDRFPQLRDRAWLAERIQARRTQRQIAEELGCSMELVAKRVREAGLIRTKPGVDMYRRPELVSRGPSTSRAAAQAADV